MFAADILVLEANLPRPAPLIATTLTQSPGLAVFLYAILRHRASPVLELAVPLGLGVSPRTVHRGIDALVDRLIFRRQCGE